MEPTVTPVIPASPTIRRGEPEDRDSLLHIRVELPGHAQYEENGLSGGGNSSPDFLGERYYDDNRAK